MNANLIIDENMTLEQKLEAIDLAMKNAQEQFDEDNGRKGLPQVPIDPSLATSCFGCE